MSFLGTSYTSIPKETRHSLGCLVCNSSFIPRSGVHKFCSDSCKGKWKYLSKQVTTETQYKAISGNWERYFSRLLIHGRKQHLTRDILLEKLNNQQGLCALSGIPLTCVLDVGIKCKTNASIDRINAGADYSPENIQLVCTALNSFRKDVELEKFIWFCEQVTNFQKRKEG